MCVTSPFSLVTQCLPGTVEDKRNCVNGVSKEQLNMESIFGKQEGIDVMTQTCKQRKEANF